MTDIMCVSEVSLKYESKIKNSERPKITDVEKAVDVFRSIERYKNNMNLFECVYCMYLSKSNRVLSVMLISEGGTIGTVLDVKKVLAPATLQNATSIILSHNHPSGELRASAADEELTNKLKQATKLMEISVLDHVIMTDEGYYSFANEGLI